MTTNQYKKDELPKQHIQTMNKQNNDKKCNKTRSKRHQTPNENTKKYDTDVSHAERPITKTKATQQNNRITIPA